jgi:hypothetical protein
MGIEVRFVLFKGKVAYDQTILYDNSKGRKPLTLEYLNSNYVFAVSDVAYPSSTADFVLILGKDSL